MAKAFGVEAEHCALSHLQRSQGCSAARSGRRQVRLATAVEPTGVAADVDIVRLRAPKRFGLPVDANLYGFSQSIARQLELKDATGVVVTRVDPAGTAGEAGLQRGDVIVEIDRKPVASVDDFEKAMSKTGGKQILGKTSKIGQRDIRRLLIIGAMAVVRWASRKGAPEGSWLRRMLARKPRVLTAIALANKMARSIWAMLTKSEDYMAPAAVGL